MTSHNGFNILINRDAGTVRNLGTQSLEQSIIDSNLNVNSLYFCSPEELLERLGTLKSNENILIGGGDGTIKSSAEIIMQRSMSMGILPMGTINLMARDLNIPVDIYECLNLYAADTQEYKIDVGLVNDEIFLCCVGYGTMPETSKLREKHRNDSQPILIPRLTAYVLKQMDRKNRKRVRLSLDGQNKTIETSAIVFSNNEYSPQEEWSENNFSRPSLQDGYLGIYSAAPYSFWDKIRLLGKLGFGNWQSDKALQDMRAKSVTLNVKENPALFSLDGETLELETPVRFRIKEKALSLILPRSGTEN